MDTAHPNVITVSELNRLARLALERGMTSLWVAGEVSNFSRAPSGHWYFTLKDSQASVRCAMFRNRNQFVDWLPGNGSQVEVRAQPTLYEPRGDFQLYVEAMRHAGLGALYEAFARLKEKLEREGLFDPGRKRPLPAMPHCVGLVTSPQAAALQDVLTTLRRRWPAARVVIYPTPVQGEGAGQRVADALRRAGERMECQVLLLVRGGGSLEDLWAFNEEVVAHALAASPIPVVTGIGHETDFTIADFAGDLRAPTPTAAAQLCTPDVREVRSRLETLAVRIRQDQRRRLHTFAQRLDGLARRLRHPAERLAERQRHLGHLTFRMRLLQAARHREARQRLAHLTARLEGGRPRPAELTRQVHVLGGRLDHALKGRLRSLKTRVETLEAHLSHLNPQAVLQRGYSIVRSGDGRIVRDSAALAVGMALDLHFASGSAGARVESLHPEDTAEHEDDPT